LPSRQATRARRSKLSLRAQVRRKKKKVKRKNMRKMRWFYSSRNTINS
jgi:hypothetical protein